MNYANYSGFSAVPSCFHGGLCTLSSSAVAETLFFSFFAFQPRRKRSFRRFWFIRRGGNAVFLIFYFSAAAEMIFLLFFTRPPWRKAIFHRFLTFIHG